MTSEKGELKKEIKAAHNEPVNCLVSNEKYLVSGSWDASIKIWDINTFEPIKTITCHEFAHAVTVCIMSTGMMIAGSQKKSLHYIDGK